MHGLCVSPFTGSFKLYCTQKGQNSILSAIGLRCMGILSCFSAILTKGKNFCEFSFAFLDEEALPEWNIF